MICLAVLRALAKEPGRLETVVSEIRTAAGADPRWNPFTADLGASLAKHARQIREGVGPESEREARRLTEKAAIALQGSLLLRYGASPVAEAFCASRLFGGGGQTYGTLPAHVAVQPILEHFSSNLVT